MDNVPKWRHDGTMNSDLKHSVARPLERLNVRLPQEALEAIDRSRASRAGNISRNTWITEAIQEKLGREQNERAPKGGHQTHG